MKALFFAFIYSLYVPKSPYMTAVIKAAAIIKRIRQDISWIDLGQMSTIANTKAEWYSIFI